MIDHDSLDQIPDSDLTLRTDLSDLSDQGIGFVSLSVRNLIVLILLWMLLIAGGCALVFRWTNLDPQDTEYSKPLRTRPPEAK